MNVVRAIAAYMALWLAFVQDQVSGYSASSSRRAFMNSVVTTTTAGIPFIAAGPAFAEDILDDLAMPSEDELKAQEEAQMKERLKRKEELKAAASRGVTFQEKMVKEKGKQKELNSKTKEERRNALCEELGRGC